MVTKTEGHERQRWPVSLVLTLNAGLAGNLSGKYQAPFDAAWEQEGIEPWHLGKVFQLVAPGPWVSNNRP